MKPLAWITGAGGLIGHYAARTAAQVAPGWDTLPLTRAQLDLTDFSAVRHLYVQRPPQLILHCAAMSRSPACQQDPPAARLHNIEVTRHLADLAAEARLVFFSTDLVFDGQKGDYEESAQVNPLSVYAETKVVAEQHVLAYPRHIVLRTSLNGGTSPTGDRGFNEQMRAGWRSGQAMKLFVDEYRNPIHARITATAAWELGLSNHSGIFHVAGEEKLSRWEIGTLLARRWPDLQPKISAGSLREYVGAPRSPDTSLNCAKARGVLKQTLTGLATWLQQNPEEPF